MDIQTITDIIRPIAESYGLKKLFVFGSVAKGMETEESDIDLLIEKGTPLSLLALSELRQTFQDALNRPVDLVTTTGIAKDFRDEIMGTEILLYEA